MATQRYISTSFWTDKWIRSLDPSERYLYMYLLTNPQTNIAGVYQITIDRIAFDTGYDDRTLRPMLDRFSKSGKAHFFRDEWVILPSWPKHQKWESKSKIRDGIVSIIQELPVRVIEELVNRGYLFDMSLLETTIIARKRRLNFSGATEKKVYEKTNGKCSMCGSSDNLNIHHIKPLKEGGDNSVDNLILLCSECHRSVHSPHMVCGLESESTYEPSYSDSDSDSDSNTDSDSDTDTDLLGAVAPVENTKPTPDPLYQAIFQSFIGKVGAFTNYPKEAQAIKRIIKYCEQHAPRYTNGDKVKLAESVITTFWSLTQNGSTFWRGQPFTPSALSVTGIFDRVLVEIGQSTPGGSNDIPGF